MPGSARVGTISSFSLMANCCLHQAETPLLPATMEIVNKLPHPFGAHLHEKEVAEPG